LYENDFKAIDFMELILKSDNENSIAKIIALAKKLDVIVEQHDKAVGDKNEKVELKKRILNFKANGTSSFGDAAEWQHNERS
jgi:hypothetical protein